MAEMRPGGRQKRVTQGGSGVHKRGDGLGTGPVGSSSGVSGRPGGATGAGGGGGRRSSGGGGGLMKIIILVIVALVGGGGGLGALLGGGGSSSGSSDSSSQNTAGSLIGNLLGSGDYTTTGAGSANSNYTPSSFGTHNNYDFDSYTDYTGTSSGTGSYGSGSYGGGSFSAGDLLGSLLGGGSVGGGSLGSGSYGSGSYGSGSYGTGSSSSGSYGGGSYGTGSYGGFQNGYGLGSGSDYSGGTWSGDDYSSGGIDLSSLAGLFGNSVSQSAAGLSSGWNDGLDNRGQLNTQVASGSRKKYTKIKGDGSDTVTVMVYLCGTDLESRSGMATSDLTEMAAASIGDNVNVIVYTGGCSGWQNNVVSSRTNQIYRVRKGGLERLVSDDGDRAMTDPATLTRFIKWCRTNFPANRNELIFWDHGSGSLSGYGYDQKHQREGSMDLTEIHDAVEAAGMKFDMIGFDTCLMATVENALSLSEFADYMVASEETEPGTGWYYTNWLGALSEDPGMPTTELGQRIIDDFVDVSAQKARGQATTLSLVDLAELENTFPAQFSAFSKKTSNLITDNSFQTVSTARTSSREFASSSKIDQVDLTDLAMKMGTEEGRSLVDSLLSAIKYNRTSTSMCNSYGLSIYFPMAKLSKVDTMVSTYKELGLDTDYTKCIQQYATMQTAGQTAGGGTHSVLDMLGGSSGGSYSGSYGSSGIGSDMLMDLVGSLLSGRSVNVEGLDRSNTNFLSESGLDAETIVETLNTGLVSEDTLVWDTSTGYHTLHLSQEQWAQVAKLAVNMLYDDGEGYIDLGMDNLFSFTQAGDLIGETDRTWISINGQPVAYYHIGTVQQGDSSVTTGQVPCLLNGQRANLIIVFDPENPYGYVAGARTDYVDGETDTLAKNMTQINTGDTIDFLCDYYGYDGTYEDSYYLGEQLTVDGDLYISNTDVGEGGALITYCLTDMYGQRYWTPAIEE